MPMIEIDTLDGDGRFGAYLAEPSSPAKSAIVVIQEVFGVNEGIRRKCDEWAGKGYLAIAPDMFWRVQPGVQLDADIEEEFQKAIQLMMKFDQDMGIRDIEATIRAARARLAGGTKVGCVGYCLGGRLAFMTATRTDIDASVGYYGVGLENLLREAHAISRPVLLHVAGADHFVPPEAQKEVHAGLDDHPRVTIFDYSGEDHGFAAEMGSRRSEAAKKLADGRTEEFFAKNLA